MSDHETQGIVEGQTDLPAGATFEKKAEFAPHVAVSEETFFGHGWQPLTIGMLQALWFLPHDTPFDIPFLVSWLDELGWKGANGKPIGEKVVRREVGLMKDAGYVQFHRLRGENGRSVGVQYVVSQRRTDQPETGSWIPAPARFRSSDHMPSLGTRGGAPQVPNEENPSSDHVSPLATRGGTPHVANGVKPQVAPRVLNGTFPPTPPLQEEEDYSSSLSSSSAAGGAAEVDAAAVAAAAEFLASLPGRWACGRKTTVRLAPLLAEASKAQGWALGAGLVKHLTRRAARSADSSEVLRERIEDLPRYTAARMPVPGETPGQRVRIPGQQLPLEGPAGHERAEQEPGDQPDGHPAPSEQEAQVSAEEVSAARELLLSLSAPWTVGPQDAARLAPTLARVAAERGWVMGEALRQQLMSNPGGGQNYLWLLEHRRIATLPDRTVRGARPATPSGKCPRHSWLELEECRCPAAAASRTPKPETDPEPETTGQEAQAPAGSEEAGAGSERQRLAAAAVARRDMSEIRKLIHSPRI